MISKKMVKALNKQINAETYSAYLYFSMSSYSSFKGLKGAAKWFFVQGQEELTHAWRQYLYVNSMSEHVVLAAVEQPSSEFKSLKHMFEETLNHERKVTALIHALVDLAVSEKDHSTEVFLQWFVTEQVEEESNASDILAKLQLAGDSASALFMMDSELGRRVFAMPPDLAAKAAPAP